MMLLKITLREESLVVEISMLQKHLSSCWKFLKLFLFHLPMHVTLCFFDLFSYKFPMHRKWVRLKCLSHLLLDSLFCFNFLFSCEHHLQSSCLAQRRKKSACWEATKFVFPSVLSGLDDCYYCSNIIVSLLFKLCAKFSLWLQERSNVGACCPETDSVYLTEKFEINHHIIFLIWIFLTVYSI